MKLRKWILKLHLYGGLLCFWYLIIYALSSLNFQHHFGFMEHSTISTKQLELKIDLSGTDSTVATRIQNSMHIPGFYLAWKTYRDDSGNFHTEIHNPRKEYTFDYNSQTATIDISEKDKGFWSVINSLHGLDYAIPNAPLTIVWKLFTYISIVVILFSIFSGIWLWSGRIKGPVMGWNIFFGIITISFCIIVIVYLKG